MPNSRARYTKALALALGGGRRRPKRLPRQLPPLGIERDYKRALLARVAVMRRTLQPLFEALPSLVAGASSRNRLDSDETDRIRELFRLAEVELDASLAFSTASLEQLAQEFASKTETWQRIQLGRQVQAAFGVDVIGSDVRLPAARDAFVQENVSLIKGMPGRTYSELQSMVTREVEAGTLNSELAKKLREKFDFNKTRADLISTDQIGKYYAKVNQTRQENMGVERFIWRDSGDERVRPMHVSYSGSVYTWAEAPEGGPGYPIRCRCYSEPVFTELIPEAPELGPLDFF